MTALPGPAQQAAQNALNASITSIESQEDASDGEPEGVEGEDSESQVLETNTLPAAPDVDRTVFEDPKSFNVKVRYSLP